MTDFKELQYHDPKDAVRVVYHSLMEMIESYCERAENLSLDDEFIDDMRTKYMFVQDTLKYNMIEIPAYTCEMLFKYCEKYLKPFTEKNWREQLEKDYASYLKKNGIQETEDEQWCHIDVWCASIRELFYDSMSRICRGMFNTQLIQDGFLAKLRRLFGEDDRGGRY